MNATQSPRKLRLETLEDRVALANNIWVGPQNGLWSNAANWSLRHAPQPSDSLIFYGPTSGIGTPGRNTSSLNDLPTVTVTSVQCFSDYTGTISIGPGTNVTTLASSTFNGQLVMRMNSRLGTVGLLNVNGGLAVNGPAVMAATTVVNTAGNSLVTGGGGVMPGLRVNAAYTSTGTLTIGLTSGPTLLAVNGTANLTGTTLVNRFSRILEQGTAPVIIAGQTTLAGATITGNDVRTVAGGTLVTTDAIDTIVGNLTNSGTVQFAGGGVHNFTVTGSYNQFLGTLWSRVGSTGRDQVNVGGAADLGNGVLNVTAPFPGPLFPGYSAVLVHANGGIRGQFGSLSFPPAIPGFRWRHTYGPNDFSIFLGMGF